MEVTAVNEKTSHAVMGGGASFDFGITDHADFFHMLSTAIYTDGPLAVVREVICNAWDAHISAGRQTTPVEIVVDKDKMTIKDFGYGIPHDKIRPIYCIYGQSTKVQDETVTGGFGLGSKAPFAYSDHFTVENCHDGVKTINALSKVSLENNGKPGFRVMVSVPTKESGLTVTIPIKNNEDRNMFLKLINRVVFYGGINARLNGQALETISVEKATDLGFYLCNTHMHGLSHNFYIMYGAVIYPITDSDEIEVKEALGLLERVKFKGMAIVMIAPPNSIGVTPSRESLSYSEKTRKTVLALSKNLVGKITNRCGSVMKEMTFSYYSSLKKGNYTPSMKFSFSPDRYITEISYDLDSMVQLHVARRFSPSENLIRRAMINAFPERRSAIRAMFKSDVGEKLSMSRFDARIITRAIMSAGLGKDTYLLTYSRSFAPQRFVANKRIQEFSGKVMFASSIKEAAAFFNENFGYSGATPMIIPARVSPEKLARLRELCARYKVEIVTAPALVEVKLAPKPKVKKPKIEFRKISSFGTRDYKSDGVEIYFSPAAVVENPKVYLDGTYIANFRPRSGIDIMGMRALHYIYPEMVACTSAENMRDLTKIGARSVFDVLMEDFERVKSTKEFLYSYLVHAKNFVDSPYLSVIHEHANRDGDFNELFLDAVFPAPFKKNTQKYENGKMIAAAIYRLVIKSKYEVGEKKIKFHEIGAEVAKQARSVLAKSLITKDDYERLSWVSMIGTYYSEPRECMKHVGQIATAMMKGRKK